MLQREDGGEAFPLDTGTTSARGRPSLEGVLIARRRGDGVCFGEYYYVVGRPTPPIAGRVARECCRLRKHVVYVTSGVPREPSGSCAIKWKNKHHIEKEHGKSIPMTTGTLSACKMAAVRETLSQSGGTVGDCNAHTRLLRNSVGTFIVKRFKKAQKYSV